MPPGSGWLQSHVRSTETLSHARECSFRVAPVVDNGTPCLGGVGWHGLVAATQARIIATMIHHLSHGSGAALVRSPGWRLESSTMKLHSLASGLMLYLGRSAYGRVVAFGRIRRIAHTQDTREGCRNTLPANEPVGSGAVLKLNGSISGFGKYTRVAYCPSLGARVTSPYSF